jgi:predicted SAM-dependent methyltransferase
MYLDIACGNHKNGPDWTGMDIQPLPGVNIVHDLNVHPWPIESNSVLIAHAWHIVEHIPPVSITPSGTVFPFINFMNECWRVLRVGSILSVETPHGASDNFLNDPTHCNPITENTWKYFDPEHQQYQIYRPQPWSIHALHATRDGNVSVELVKQTLAN